MIDHKQIIVDVFSKYGIKMDEDDSILVFLSVHDALLEQYTQELEKSLISSKDSCVSELKAVIEKLEEQHKTHLEETEERHKANTDELRLLINEAANNILNESKGDLEQTNAKFVADIERLLQSPFENQTQNNTLVYILTLVSAGSALFTLILLGFFVFMN